MKINMENISVEGFEEFLYYELVADNVAIPDEEIQEKFSDYLSNLEVEDIVNSAKVYCKKMGENDAFSPIYITSAFMEANFGK